MPNSAKLTKAHSHIDGLTVARMIIEFQREFRDVYYKETLESSLCAVGPLQSMIGLAIANGGLALPTPPAKGTDQ